MKKFYFLPRTNTKLLSQIKGSSKKNYCYFLKFMVSARDGYCDDSTWAPKEPNYGIVWQHCKFSSSGAIGSWLKLSVTIHRTESCTFCT